MENHIVFSNIEKIENALKNGIEIKSYNTWITPPGYVSLTYHPLLEKFILVFGNTAANAGYVTFDDLDKTWRIKNNG